MLGEIVLGKIVAATSAAIAAGALGYQSMAPTALWYGPTFTGNQSPVNSIALTYDDGPNDPHTLRLLDVLAKHEVKATFFLIGRYAKLRPDIVRDIVQAGHAVGNHTFTHPNLIFASAKDTHAALTECQDAIGDATGQMPTLFRPPFGGRRPATLRIARELGLEPIMWNVTGWDWNAPSAQKIVDGIDGNVSRNAQHGSVILLHDGGHKAFGADRSQTVLSTEQLILKWKLEGFQFLAIDEMLKAPKLTV
jgi:peptidoglycan-N-acetylglucosamine deacetylase